MSHPAAPFQFGTGLYVSFQHLWIHRDVAKHSRRAVPADAPDEVVDTGDLRVLFCLVAAYGVTTKGSCVCTHRIQFANSIETGL